MRIPRIFGQNQVTIPANSKYSLDSNRFSNDGDLPVALADIMMKTQRTWVQIRSTRGIEWMKEPVFSPLLCNEYRGVNSSDALLRRWRLRHPFYLGPHDGLNLHLENRTAQAATFGMSIQAVKDQQLTEAPRAPWTPRILFAEEESDSAITEAMLDTQRLQNWGDKPMCVHAISVVAENVGGARLDFDSFSMRIRVGGDLWMRDDNSLPIGMLRSYWTNQIQIPDVWVKPTDTFYVRVSAAASTNVRTIRLAVIGSVGPEERMLR